MRRLLAYLFDADVSTDEERLNENAMTILVWSPRTRLRFKS
jgi:hypothetical protein